MTSREWLHELQEQVLEQAKTSLRERDSEAYHLLTEFAERLQNLSRDQKPAAYQLIEIFSVNGQHRAELVPGRITEGKNRCVVFDGEFHTPSGIGSKLMGYQVNGWVWWQYRTDKGQIRPIDDFRKPRKT